jgi:hypothetical protein
MCNQPQTMGSLSANAASPSQVSEKKNVSNLQVPHAGPDGPLRKKVCLNKEPVAVEEKTNETKVAWKGGSLSYTDQDVLSGRGGGTNLHNGNRIYRDLILSHRETYDIASKAKKPGVSRKIVQMIRDRGGRFFRKEKDGLYYDIGDEASREKTSQALRHRTFEMRNKEDAKRKKGGAKLQAKKREVRICTCGCSPSRRAFSNVRRRLVVQAETDLSPKGPGAASPAKNLFPENTKLSLSGSTTVVKLNGGLESQQMPQNKFAEDQMVQDKVYRDALARQRELRDARQDPAYLKAMIALRQRDAMLDRAMANEAHMRRCLALNSGFPPARTQLNSGLLHHSAAMLSGGSGHPQAINGLGLTRQDPSLYFLPERMLTPPGISRSYLFRGGRTQGEQMVQFPGQDARTSAPPSDANNVGMWGSDRRSV